MPQPSTSTANWQHLLKNTVHASNQLNMKSEEGNLLRFITNKYNSCKSIRLHKSKLLIFRNEKIQLNIWKMNDNNSVKSTQFKYNGCNNSRRCVCVCVCVAKRNAISRNIVTVWLKWKTYEKNNKYQKISIKGNNKRKCCDFSPWRMKDGIQLNMQADACAFFLVRSFVLSFVIVVSSLSISYAQELK